MELQADKLISLIDGPLLDENGQVIRFMTLQGADRLIRKWAEKSETAASYVKAVGGINYVKSLGLMESGSPKDVGIINGNDLKSNVMVALGMPHKVDRDLQLVVRKDFLENMVISQSSLLQYLSAG